MKKARAMRRITLENDFGGQVSFIGKLENETMHYDESSGELLSEKLFTSERNRIGYSISAKRGEDKQKRAYLLEEEEDVCVVSNGSITVGLEIENLLTFFSQALTEQSTENSSTEPGYIRKQFEAINS